MGTAYLQLTDPDIQGEVIGLHQIAISSRVNDEVASANRAAFAGYYGCIPKTFPSSQA